MVIRQNVGSDYKAEYKYYILTKTQSLFPKGNLINFNNKAVGSYAEYVEVDIKGSTSQNPIGFMFGERSTTKELRNFVNSVKSNDPYDANFDSIDLDASLDAIDLTPGIALSANAVVVANEKGIQVDGENISKLDPASQEIEAKDLVEPEVEPTGNEDLFDEGKSIDISANSFFSTLLADNDAAELTTWWDTNVDDPFSQQALDNRNKLKAHRDNADMKFKVTDLDDFIQMFEDSEFTNEQEFLDHFNNCYL
jgi:hypothetical protein